MALARNMGTADRLLRSIVAVVLAVAAFVGNLPSPWPIVLGIAAVVLLLTSFVGVCPMYLPLRISTRKQ
ncbi:MAG: DUF2892 domain-containing protein [Chlorobiota bacterium]